MTGHLFVVEADELDGGKNAAGKDASNRLHLKGQLVMVDDLVGTVEAFDNEVNEEKYNFLDYLFICTATLGVGVVSGSPVGAAAAATFAVGNIELAKRREKADTREELPNKKLETLVKGEQTRELQLPSPTRGGTGFKR